MTFQLLPIYTTSWDTTLARKNPQETLHKIRFGHPGSDMPSMVVDAGLGEKQISDLLAYTQTLKQ
ncbi:MAG: hypothetical protein Tsb0017_24680 [Geothermobacteraceae bacterium]